MTSVEPDPWQNILNRKLKLNEKVEFICHRYRDVPWFLVYDQTSGNYFRCSKETYLFLKLLNGRNTVATAYGLLQNKFKDQMPEISELLMILANLHGANLLTGWSDDEIKERFARHHQKVRQQKIRRWLRPLAIKIPLWNPDNFLQRYLHLVRGVFSGGGFLLWGMLVLIAFFQVIANWNSLQLYWQSRFLDGANLAVVLVLYPIVKLIHELGHGFSIKRWGGQVHELGIMLLVFVPLPYVDASSSNSFYLKRQRMVVAAAGIMVEIGIAAMAMLCWLQLETSFAKDVCFNLMVICGVSTVLFNGNPLLRFDGYYLLMDAIEVPNLGSRSNRYFRYLFRRYGLGSDREHSPVTAKGEKKWFVLYGIASNLYRVYISIVIALFVAGKYFFIGVALAIWAFLGQILVPIGKAIHGHYFAARQLDRTPRFVAIFAGVSTVIALVVFVIPVSFSVSAEGVVVLKGESRISAAVSGFNSELLVQSGEQVQSGQPIMRLLNPDLEGDKKLLMAEIRELEVKRDQVMLSDQVQANIYRSMLNTKRERLAELNTEIESLQVVSRISGVVFIPNEADWQGQWVEKGDLLAHVIDKESVQAVVAIPQQDIEEATTNLARMIVRFESEPDRTFSASLVNQIPMALNRLPSPVLGSQNGGAILVDARDPDGVTPMGQVFLLNLTVHDWPSISYLGARIKVRFEHAPQVLGFYLVRRVQHYLSQR